MLRPQAHEKSWRMFERFIGRARQRGRHWYLHHVPCLVLRHRLYRRMRAACAQLPAGSLSHCSTQEQRLCSELPELPDLQCALGEECIAHGGARYAVDFFWGPRSACRNMKG